MEDDRLKLKAPWAEVKEKIKENNIALSDDDLQYTPGKESELLNHLANKMNRTPEQVKAWIESISANKGQAS